MRTYSRYWRLLAVLLSFLLLAAACGDDDGDAQSADPGATEPGDGDGAPEDGDATPDRDGTMILVHTISPTQWDPHQGNSAVVDYSIMGPIYDRLIVLEPDQTLGPMLATDWEVSDDQQSITFNLRDDVTFHDGSEFNAEVVKANFDRMKAIGSRWSALLETLEETVVVDDYTVRMDFSEPAINFPMQMALTPGISAIISPNGLDNPDSLATEPAGSGLYQLAEQREDAAVYERFDDYWDQELVDQSPARVELQSIPALDARLNAVRTGQAHAAVLIDPIENLDEIQADEAISYYEVADTNRTLSVPLNFDHPALGDPSFRRALSLATDRETIAEFVLFDQCSPAVTPLAPGTFGHNPATDFDPEEHYDVEEARRLIEEGGYEGTSFNLQFFNQAGPRNVATALQEQWGEIGVDVNIVGVEIALANAAFQDGENEAYVQQAGGFPDPHPLLDQLYIRLPGGTDPTFEEMEQEASLLPLESTERDEAYQEVSAYMAENPVNIVLCHAPPTAIHRNTLHGIDQSALMKLQTAWDPRNMWISGPPEG